MSTINQNAMNRPCKDDFLNPQASVRLMQRKRERERTDTQYRLNIHSLTENGELKRNTANLPALTSVDFTVTESQS